MAMTAPSAAEQAATWVIENPPSRAMGRYTYGRDGYLAGHAAGEQAGIEKERARVLAEIKDMRATGELLHTQAVRLLAFCGGRIQTEDR